MKFLLLNLSLTLYSASSFSLPLQHGNHVSSSLSSSSSSSSLPTTSTTALSMFSFGSGGGGGGTAKIPKSDSDRDNQAINAVKSAINKPRKNSIPLIECEFPPLGSLNKMGDGSLRSALEAEEANIAFVSKLVKGISPIPAFGPKINILMSSASSKSFYTKTESKLKNNANLISLKDGMPSDDVLSKKDVCIVMTPSGRNDFLIAQKLASSGAVSAVVIVNAFAKDPKSIPAEATMGYFLKPLTYNSQIAGYLVRSYPSDWTVLDGFSKEVLGTFTDDEIRVKNTNTPNLIQPGKMVQSAFDQRAIRARGI